MEKRKKWQFFLIVGVLILTIYNILPTLFYYAKPLKAPIDQKKAEHISHKIQLRINQLEQEALDWTDSFCSLLKISPLSIQIKENAPQEIVVHFQKSEDAKKFKKHLPRAGSFISFVPSQLSLAQSLSSKDPKKVIITRRIPIRFNLDETNEFFEFSFKKDDSNYLTPLYKEVVFDRVAQIASAVGSESETAQMIDSVLKNEEADQALFEAIANNLLANTSILTTTSSARDRFFSKLLPQNLQDSSQSVKQLLGKFDKQRDQLKLLLTQLKKEEKELSAKGQFLKENQRQLLYSTEKKERNLTLAREILKKNASKLQIQSSWSYKQIKQDLIQSYKEDQKRQILQVGNKNPFIESIIIDWENDQIQLALHSDLANAKATLKNTDQFDQLLINEIARISKNSGEQLTPQADHYSIELASLTDSKSFLILNLPQIAAKQVKQLEDFIKRSWHPKHPELKAENFPIVDYKTYQAMPKQEKLLSLVLYAPALQSSANEADLKNSSIYIIAKGLDKILHKYQGLSDTTSSEIFLQDFYDLQTLLAENGFINYSGRSHLNSEFKEDFIFEKDHYYNTILTATREDFREYGSKKFAILEFTDVEQRLLALNNIETRVHEDLLKWRDDHLAAQIGMNSIYDVPKPKKNVFLQNLKLNLKKYFRGDERKVLHWGLDLSGGKTISIELRDQNNQIVKNETDIKQGINELYSRVNKMGVSEVNIRQEGTNILLDFPGSQSMKASDLVKASSMTFHIVNEKFSPNNPVLAQNVNTFLQEVWNEAVVTNRKDIDSIQSIAKRHLYGNSYSSDDVQPLTESAKTLYENGLRLSINDEAVSFSLNDTISKVAILKGDDFKKWEGQTHPLMFVFRNFALEGSSLDNIRAGYDPSKGNFLSFEVKSSVVSSDGQKIKPRNELHNWTSQFAKEAIQGTPNEAYSHSRGWRMAVILNDYVISHPTLDSDLKDSAMITGSFSQREINQLTADLKAGSLTFTPKILSEKNVSPELGHEDRMQGIVATIIALILVVIAMTAYYRFAGLVASIAVLFNLLIMWAVLQNLSATLTLAGIAGIILTVGMAVDANVLVFERIREEFALTGRIASALNAGYKKAFSAILDSNVTTIIAALILLNFDSGPIKGFAITLIIGIASSMFTALFMTRYFFAGWVQNPKNTSLKMSNFVQAKKFDFLKKSKFVYLFSGAIILFGSLALHYQRNSVLGVDFTGGFALNIEMEAKKNTDYRKKVEQALIQKGAKPQDISIRVLSPSNHLRIILGTSMEQPSKPFYNLPLEVDSKSGPDYLTNPRIAWVVGALNDAGLKIAQENQLSNNWSIISGQMSDSMRNNAIISLLIALLAILVYITIRFEFKFSISAMICLIHDVLISLGIIGILHLFDVPLQIDLNTIAAIMTIIGYSLNDTIIIFDRIREDLSLTKKAKWSEVVNHALNTTLSRTLITSGTTFLVLLALVLFGGSSIFSFAFIMGIGVVFGTLSSLFIASPIMLMLHNLEVKKQQKLILER